MDKAEQQSKEQWYAIKVFYNKVFNMEDILFDMGLETYLAVRKVQLKGAEHMAAARKLASVPPGHRTDARYIQEGPVIYERKPLVTSLIFVKATASQIKEVAQCLKDEAPGDKPLGFVYKKADFKEYAAIPDSQMTSFRLVAESGLSGLDFFADEEMTRYKTGDRVRVTGGPLKGAEGYIKRIKKNNRLLVCIEGVIAVATSYIPSELLEKVVEP
jgi:transcription antitermination factor NusG